jgi:cysteine desulfurase
MPKSNKKVYMDYASSALFEHANPGAIHELGIKERNKLERARTNISKILNAHDTEIVFTSGATESNNLAILGLVNNFRQSSSKLPHIVTTNIEHASVLEVCKHLEKTKQAEVAYVPVEANGVVDPAKIKKVLKPNTILVSVMYANNEIGTIQPIREIAKEVRHFRKLKAKGKNFLGSSVLRGPTPRPDQLENLSLLPFFHTDATQAINYLPINVAELGVDLVSFNSAKIYGPKGVGALYVRRNTPLSPIMFGGNQEFGLRPGTESVDLAVEFAKALQTAETMKEKEIKRLTKLRNYFLNKIVTNSAIAENVTNSGIIINGDLKNRLPNNINVTIPNIPSDLLVIELSARGIMASAKSACKAGDGKASHVIESINKNIKEKDLSRRSNAEEDGSLRFSLGRGTTKADIDYTIKALSEILNKLKKWYN